MRAIITGQVGLNKRSYLDAVATLAREAGVNLTTYHVGDCMYAEGRDVPAGRILDLPLSRLHALRRSVFKDIIAESAGKQNILVNTHATFRWRHGLFRAFDFDQMEKLQPDLFICLLDNIESVAYRLHKEHVLDATLKDLMVWREEEMLATELLARAMGRENSFFILARGRSRVTTSTCLELIHEPKRTKVYLSFPMSHVMDMPTVLAEIDRFRAALGEHFITFDPGDVDEKALVDQAIAAAKDGRDFLEGSATELDGTTATFPISVKQILDVASNVDGQIYARDFMLIDQSDMIISLVPELPGGLPGLSSGVERELQHAFEHGKKVYVIWKPRKAPSPFITQTASRVFRSVDEALEHFASIGLTRPKAGGPLFVP